MSDQQGKRAYPPGGFIRRMKAELIKSCLILSGIATPDGTHPTGRHFTILRAKINASVLTLAGFASTYFFVVLPIREAHHTGTLHQTLIALVLSICLAYGGIVSLITDQRDEKTMFVGPGRRLWWTSLARLTMYGMWFVTGLVLLAWYLYVRLIGVRLIWN